MHCCTQILACTRLPVNICNTQVIHVMSLHLVCHTTHVVYSYSRHIQTMKFIGFAAWQLLIVFCTDEIDGHILINKYKKHMYNVYTRVKSNSYIASHSLNHISYFMHWKVEVDSRQKGFILMSITWKAYWGAWSYKIHYSCVMN